MSVHLKLAQFEGPLELLLSLIEEQKLDITKVSLAEVADQYLAFIAERRDISLEHLSSFLVIAARLILLKSKMLLPTLEFTEEEEAAIEDLEQRLIEYRRYKEAAAAIGVMLLSERRLFSREKFQQEVVAFSPPKGMTVFILKEQFDSILGEIPVKTTIEEQAIEEVVRLEDKIAELRRSIETRAECAFHEMLCETNNKMDIVVSFLAILELVKQRLITADQRDTFGSIRMRVSSREESVSMMQKNV